MPPCLTACPLPICIEPYSGLYGGSVELFLYECVHRETVMNKTESFGFVNKYNNNVSFVRQDLENVFLNPHLHQLSQVRRQETVYPLGILYHSENKGVYSENHR